MDITTRLFRPDVHCSFHFQQQSSTVSFLRAFDDSMDQRTGMAVSCESSWLSTVQGRTGSTTLTSLHLCYRWLRQSGKAVESWRKCERISKLLNKFSLAKHVQQSSNALVCLQHDVLEAVIAFTWGEEGLPKQNCQLLMFCHIRYPLKKLAILM